METNGTHKKIEIKGAHYDPEMDKYNGIMLFPEKLKQAEEDIRNSNLLEFLEKINRKAEVDK